jgi:elongation factor 1-alpha
MMVRNITLLGHKDHGKSTLIGSMLMLTNSVTQARIREARIYSKKLHKGFEPAFILDSFHEERTGGLTIDITRAEIPYRDTAFSFIDVPGHEELIKNMISGASYASTALLLVSAKKGEGVRDQTKRHLFIARMLGIQNLVVAINKMDTVHYDEKRFSEMKSGILPFIKKIGFDETAVKFVPISAYKREGIIGKSKNMKWYSGEPLIAALYAMSKEKSNDSSGPVRVVLQGFNEGSRDMLVGKLVRGTLKEGEEDICIVPQNINIKAKEIIVNGKKVKKAKAGESVAIKLGKRIDGEVRGSIVCGLLYCPIPRSTISSIVFLTSKPGKNLSIRFNGVEVPVKSMEIKKRIDPTTGESDPSKSAKPLEAVEANLNLSIKIAAEKFTETKEIGRFVLYSDGKFSGIGIIV